MKLPLNTDEWSGSIKSSKAPSNTEEWSGFTFNFGCDKSENIKNYGSYDACLEEMGKKIQEQVFSKDDLSDLTSNLNKQNIKNYITYALIGLAVVGVLLYDKYKK